MAESAGDVRVTVLIPTYDGAARIAACLDSLAAQTLPARDFEILVVQNGPACDTPDVVRRFADDHPALTIRLLELTEPGAGHARNVGVHAARGTYLTYLDDDDQLSPGALEAMLDVADDKVMPIMLMGEHADPASEVSFDNYVSRSLQPFVGRLLPVERMKNALGFNGGRLVETRIARQVRYDETLRSGEDLVHWMQMLARFPFHFRVVDPGQDAVYRRLVRPGSRGRQGDDHDFLVTQRLDCMVALVAVPVGDAETARVRDDLLVAQAAWVNRYLRECPDEHGRVVQDIRRRGLRHLRWATLNRDLGRELVLHLSETTAGVTANRIATRGVPVDLIHGRPRGQAPLERGWIRLIEHLLDRRRSVPIDAAPETWAAAGELVEAVEAAVSGWEAGKGGHARVITRSESLPAHLAAAYLKVTRPGLEWVLEAPPRFHPLLGSPSDHPALARTLRLLDEAVSARGERGRQVPGEAPDWLGLADRVIEP